MQIIVGFCRASRCRCSRLGRVLQLETRRRIPAMPCCSPTIPFDLAHIIGAFIAMTALPKRHDFRGISQRVCATSNRSHREPSCASLPPIGAAVSEDRMVTSGDSSSSLTFAPPLAKPPAAIALRSIARRDRANGRGASAGPPRPVRDIRDRIPSEISGLSFSPRTTKIAITKMRARAPICGKEQIIRGENNARQG